jgi:hypothetical protein
MRCQSGGDEMDDISLALLTRFAEAYLAERKGSRLEILALGAGAAHDGRILDRSSAWRTGVVAA